ncbi:MAG: IS1634 family transposase [Candidatus Brocadiae bacterium]|nr:IS1634 family transposase [Candidatus Brocadiia bacterium]
MFLKPCYRTKNGKRHAYWALVESYRTARGPRHRVVAYLGQAAEPKRRGVKRAAGGRASRCPSLFDEAAAEWVEVDVKRLRVERCLDFGGPWLGLQILRRLELIDFLEEIMPAAREEIPWPLMATVLVLCRLCQPSSELHIAEHLYKHTAIADLLGIPPEKINEQRLYRALDKLLVHKEALQIFLKNRLGNLFDLEYDLLLYDMTSTYFEGEAKANPKAQRGYSRDRRPDCKQICIALVVTKEGMPLGYETFAGNRSDVTTVEEIVETMEDRYGRADRIWGMDRGMISEENLQFLRDSGRRYIVGTPKGMLRKFERELLSKDWESIRDGLEVKRVTSPDGAETFILCRSEDRREKEKAIHERFAWRIEEGLKQMEASCRKRKYKVVTIAKRLGKLLGRNSRAAGLFETDVVKGPDGGARLVWRKVPAWRRWAELSEGCYLLRSNVKDWTGEELWRAYMQLTDAEEAFRIHKTDLQIRPIWHQKEERVDAHILVCFLAYVIWKTLAQMCRQAGLGDEPRRVLAELGRIKLVDVVLPTRDGTQIRRRCVTRPDDHQAILLQRLGLNLPSSLPLTDKKPSEM